MLPGNCKQAKNWVKSMDHRWLAGWAKFTNLRSMFTYCKATRMLTNSIFDQPQHVLWLVKNGISFLHKIRFMTMNPVLLVHAVLIGPRQPSILGYDSYRYSMIGLD